MNVYRLFCNGSYGSGLAIIASNSEAEAMGAAESYNDLNQGKWLLSNLLEGGQIELIEGLTWAGEQKVICLENYFE